MLFQFAPAIQAGINSGALEVVQNQVTGQLLGLARDKVTGQFIAHAVGVVGGANPLFAPVQMAMGGLQIAQTHIGFQKTYKILDTLQNSVGVLQSTTALIGVGTFAGLALSAVNLHQTLKLKEDVKQLRLEVKNGFIDMKKAFKEHNIEIAQHIENLANDIEFKQHRTILIYAYGHFIEAINWLKNSLQLQNLSDRNTSLSNIEGMLRKSLADYNNPELYNNTCAAAKLRRMECAQAIEQTITLTYQLRGEYDVVCDRLSNLQQKIRYHSIELVDSCQSEEELDFLFPELQRIHNHDLAVLDSWQNAVDWQRSLSPNELKLLENIDPNGSEIIINPDFDIDDIPSEIIHYEKLKQESHFESLRQQLKFMVEPNSRREHEQYISHQATELGYKALAPCNWEKIPDVTVANLYCYFKEKQT
ncbi:hypothetical protein [Brunnivagina elsteri]|uniref:Uncharacterized protein n=1 Tax=Brunnivagina elsteri CCALA 953 TaxID=987040 RepID=A0A2A2TH96_9CYAN|nr:hypothetical protein [Calothrix elsteri]PAX53061.1 hypothetical protein CK510_15930 [Calothrix elsteri CCALA 953]